MWIGCAGRGRAYKVIRRYDGKGFYRCVNQFGKKFNVSDRDIELYGYQVLKAKPKYAPRGVYDRGVKKACTVS